MKPPRVYVDIDPLYRGQGAIPRLYFGNDPTTYCQTPEHSADPRGFLADYAHGAVFDEFRRAPVSIYRDAKGNEVDLIISTGTGSVPVEIKSSATCSSDLSKGIKLFRSLALADPEQQPAYLIPALVHPWTSPCFKSSS